MSAKAKQFAQEALQRAKAKFANAPKSLDDQRKQVERSNGFALIEHYYQRIVVKNAMLAQRIVVENAMLAQRFKMDQAETKRRQAAKIADEDCDIGISLALRFVDGSVSINISVTEVTAKLPAKVDAAFFAERLAKVAEIEQKKANIRAELKRREAVRVRSTYAAVAAARVIVQPVGVRVRRNYAAILAKIVIAQYAEESEEKKAMINAELVHCENVRRIKAEWATLFFQWEMIAQKFAIFIGEGEVHDQFFGIALTLENIIFDNKLVTFSRESTFATQAGISADSSANEYICRRFEETSGDAPPSRDEFIAKVKLGWSELLTRWAIQETSVRALNIRDASLIGIRDAVRKLGESIQVK